MSEHWVCKNCGYDKGDMEVLGDGKIKCPCCGTQMFIKPDGELMITWQPQSYYKDKS
jgi:DNA-directed RNA polymerase subunit RPC12/RpoP